jgi:hypothetical protein
MNAVITPSDVKSSKPAPNQNPLLERLHLENEPHEEKPGASLAGSILRGAILSTFAVGALTLLVVGLNPVVFVTLLLLVTALAPVLLLGFAIVITNDLKRHGMANTSEQPCSCHQDRLESTFSKR